MDRHVIIVPKGVRYISEWNNNFPEGQRLIDQLPKDGHYIMNKSITGCGYTEYCITGPEPVILCSPRLVLLKNKEDQHSDMENLLYLRNEFEEFDDFDRDINKDDLRSLDKIERAAAERREKANAYSIYINDKIQAHRTKCNILKKPVKILVSYDSFRRVKEALGDAINYYNIVVDEFQSIFCDSRFKSDTENEFLYQLRDIKSVCYLSATPMMDEYLDMLDEFRNLPYYELDWNTEDSSRIIKPYLKTKQINGSITSEVKKIIQTYKNGDFEKLTRKLEDGTFEEVYSKEAVIYVNSVANICDIIRKADLQLSETNILCASDDDNHDKIRKAFKQVDNTITSTTNCIGTVPKEGEPHKMFTLCTRTVYLGADFYSTCARSFIFSDANIDSLSVDITLDLPQILGRQRLDINPWKNRAELFFKLNAYEVDPGKFKAHIDKKKELTDSLLKAFDETTQKHNLAIVYQRDAKTTKYKFSYVAVNKHGGSDLLPDFNSLVMVSEIRAFEIQQKDYKDRFTVFSSIVKDVTDNIDDINDHLSQLYEIKTLAGRYKYFCSLPDDIIHSILPHLPESYTNYYTVLGVDKMRALGYNATDMKKEYEGRVGNQSIDIKTPIISEFQIGSAYTKSYIKNKLGDIYNSLGYFKTPKALDIEDYFVIKNKMIYNEETGKRDAGYLIVDIKKEN